MGAPTFSQLSALTLEALCFYYKGGHYATSFHIYFKFCKIHNCHVSLFSSLPYETRHCLIVQMERMCVLKYYPTSKSHANYEEVVLI